MSNNKAEVIEQFALALKREGDLGDNFTTLAVTAVLSLNAVLSLLVVALILAVV